jgi:hypothetical protein
MLEALRGVLIAASYTSNDQKIRAFNLSDRCRDEIVAQGGNAATADGGTATTVAGAILIARQNVAGQSFGNSTARQQMADGLLVRLRDQLASLGVT